jgi:hypothetical protein
MKANRSQCPKTQVSQKMANLGHQESDNSEFWSPIWLAITGHIETYRVRVSSIGATANHTFKQQKRSASCAPSQTPTLYLRQPLR